MAAPDVRSLSDQGGRSFIGRSIGTYRIVRQLGQGGMGQIYEAVHENIGQRAAVKLLSPKLSGDGRQVDRFLGEARAISAVPHPGLVKIFDCNRLPDGTVFILMELLQGEPLWSRYERLQREGTWLTLQDALRITRQMASALAAVHAQGIIHRDLKPENVIIVPDPEAIGGERTKLVDFGIAKIGGARLTSVGQTLGTPIYMSPEQCAGGDLDAKSDVYSLGVMLYEILARKPPFVADEGGAIMASHIFREPPPLSGLRPAPPEPVCTLVHQMLAKSPEQRPDMNQVLGRLVELESTGQIPLIGAQDPSVVMRVGTSAPQRAFPAQQQQRPHKRQSWPLLIGVGCAGALMFTLATWLALRQPAPVPVAQQAAKADRDAQQAVPPAQGAPSPDGAHPSAARSAAEPRPATASAAPAAAPAPGPAARDSEQQPPSGRRHRHVSRHHHRGKKLRVPKDLTITG